LVDLRILRSWPLQRKSVLGSWIWVPGLVFINLETRARNPLWRLVSRLGLYFLSAPCCFELNWYNIINMMHDLDLKCINIKIAWNCVVFDIWKQLNILIVTLLFDMCHFLLQRLNRPVEAGLKTFFMTISEGQKKCCASGAYIYRRLDKLRGGGLLLQGGNS
jgi:hypothetical protein